MVPLWKGVPITEGWWWLSFSDGPGPRRWDGTFWDRGSVFVGAEDYAEYPILGPCLPPQSESPIDYDVILRAYGWTLDHDGQVCGLTAGDMGYEGTGIYLPKDHILAWQEAQ